jgi:hypothetical protein
MRTWMKATGLLLLLIAAAGLALLASQPTEPKYNDKPLSFWIARYQSYIVYPHNHEAEDAILAIGTNAIPILLRWMTHDTPVWRKNLADLERKYVHTGIFALRYRPEHDLATQCLSILGTNALPALPALVKLIRQTDKPSTATLATFSLAHLGPQALPYLATALSSKNHIQRAAAVSSICQIYRHGAPTGACTVPLLTATADPDPLVRQLATNALSGIAPNLLTTARAN